jgi:short-subunit dehydrogenase
MTAWRGKWALVTGASAGIGQDLAKQLAADGVHLVLTARRGDRLTQLAGELRERHKIQVEICIADLTQPQAPRELHDFTQRKNLPVEILINNAGFGINGDFFLADEQRTIAMAQVNVVAVMHLTRLFVPAMVERHSGYVMIVASTAAFQPVPYLSAYAATKAFDLLLAGGLAEELRPHGIRVCALCPGPTATEFQQVAGHTARMDRSKEPAEKVARIGLRALAAGKPLVISGFTNWAGTEAQRLIPRSWVTRAIAHMYKP